MRRAAKVTLTGLMLGWIAPAMAGPLENANAAYDRGDYATALRILRPLAGEGNPAAQVNLGFMYHYGEGVPQNFAQALTWYRRAAEQGYAMAQYDLGIMYATGQGVPEDHVQAHKWFTLAVAGFSPSEKAQRDWAMRYLDRLAATMSPAQIAEARKLADEWTTSR